MKYRLVGIGEILWDVLPSGRKLGGAPANFAYHAHSLGEIGVVVSRVGSEDLGDEIRNALKGLGIVPDFITIDEIHPTGTVSVEVDSGGVPDYIIHEEVAWDYIPETDGLLELAKRTDAVCFGSLAQRAPVSRETIRKFLANTLGGALRIFDINLRQKFYSKSIIEDSLQLANILKVNDAELSLVVNILGLDKDEKDPLKMLSELFELRLIALTKGASGSVLYSEGQKSVHNGYSVKVNDTIGAGDGFTAAMTIGVLKGYELHRINVLANRVASYICTQFGATPEIPHEIMDLF
jgi:fructokinase